ncbi:hypothetical protein BJY01DRAFT_216042 [Aspergillus pseudoustus]|uniref:Secreted protein n=1 Tax=Aspergillus pseudoustus TaxID=1810923 RepID=A0ABR4JSU4_9EURO
MLSAPFSSFYFYFLCSYCQAQHHRRTRAYEGTFLCLKRRRRSLPGQKLLRARLGDQPAILGCVLDANPLPTFLNFKNGGRSRLPLILPS